MDEREKAARLDLLRFQVGELRAREAARRRGRGAGNTRRVLSNAEKLQRLCDEAYAALYESDEAALARLGTVWKRVAELAEVDPVFRPHLEARDAIKSQLEDLAQSCASYGENIDASPAKLQEVEDRLALIERLKRKYGPTLADVIARGSDLAGQLDALRARRRAARRASTPRCQRGARRIPEAGARRSRSSAARPPTRIRQPPAGRCLASWRWDGRSSRCGSTPSAPEPRGPRHGIDVAECYLSANVGEDLRPLARIASGGELSRVMLAIRTLAAAGAPGKTLIFDEIDAGIGGRVADVVGKNAARASARPSGAVHHAPAANRRRAATRISRSRNRSRNGRTQTARRASSTERQRVEEVARMIGGAAPTDAARAAARELLGESEAKAKAKAKGESAQERSVAERECSASESEPRLSMKYFIETYGCQMNVHDSERMAGLLEQAGYERDRRPQRADVVVINTCSVRERAEEQAVYTARRDPRGERRDRARRRLWPWPAAWRSRRPARCLRRSLADRRGRRHAEPEAASGADRRRPSTRRRRRASTSTRTKTSRFRSAWRGGTIRSRRTSPSSKAATSSVRSAWCPYTRGHERMRPKRDIVDEVVQAAAEGHKEIQLLGQIVNHYQAPDDPACDFAALLEAVHEVPGRRADPVCEPASAARADAAALKRCAICRRSASTSICRCSRARRASSRRCAAATRARAIWSWWHASATMVPGIALTTDMIVGFPGETEADFDDTHEPDARRPLREHVLVQIFAAAEHAGAEAACRTT